VIVLGLDAKTHLRKAAFTGRVLRSRRLQPRICFQELAAPQAQAAQKRL